MIEILRWIWEVTVSGEHAVTVSAWCLTVVTALDAKVGVRIYTRTTILINLLVGKVSKPETPAPDPLKVVHAAKTLNAVPDRYIRA